MEDVKGIGAQLFRALVENLHIWASILPQVYDDIGIYQPVNSSGLSPEVTELMK